jgi:hypothetical protein
MNDAEGAGQGGLDPLSCSRLGGCDELADEILREGGDVQLDVRHVSSWVILRTVSYERFMK